MKHCIIMTAYKDADMLNEFIGHVPDDWGLYIHVDRKSPLREADIIRGKIYKKFKIYWGAREHLDSMLFMLREAAGEGYDYYHLVTGQDFFAVNPKCFDEILGSEGRIYMQTFRLPVPDWWNYRILQYRTLASYCNIQRRPGKRLNRMWLDLQSRLGMERRLPDYPLYGGVLYCSLPHDAVIEVMGSDVAQDLYSRLKNSVCAEEIFLQTVLMNSSMCGRVTDNSLRFMDWDDPCPPRVLDDGDFDSITASGCLFCRKIDSGRSAGLLRRLVEYIGR